MSKTNIRHLFPLQRHVCQLNLLCVRDRYDNATRFIFSVSGLAPYCRNKKRFHHQALVEIRILDHLRRRDKDGLHNVIHMLDYFYFRSHLCISFELLRSVK